MTHMLFALSLGFGGLILATQSGYAAMQCAPRGMVVAQLADRYGAAPRGIGRAGTAALAEVLVSAGANWTVTVPTPDGMSCLLAWGRGWEAPEEALPARGDPA